MDARVPVVKEKDTIPINIRNMQRAFSSKL